MTNIKDKIPTEKRCGVLKCEANSVRQTVRNLEVRKKEHFFSPFEIQHPFIREQNRRGKVLVIIEELETAKVPKEPKEESSGQIEGWYINRRKEN